jgi:hypothetical protein
MSTVMKYKHDQAPNQSVSLVECDGKKPVLIRITALDMVGLTWIFKDDDLFEDLKESYLIK